MYETSEFSQATLEALAYDEAVRLLEIAFSTEYPYTVIIEDDGIPYTQQDLFYQMVERELNLKGEKISRRGQYFKIDRYQARPKSTKV